MADAPFQDWINSIPAHAWKTLGKRSKAKDLGIAGNQLAAYDLTDEGVYQSLPNCSLSVSISGRRKSGAPVESVKLASGDKMLAELDKTGIDWLDKIVISFRSHDYKQFSFTLSTYANIKKSVFWQQLYNVQKVDWQVIDPKSLKSKPKKIDVVFCRQCGWQIPLRLASIDHQDPKSKLGHRVLLKFLRIINATTTQPSGEKGLYLQAHLDPPKNLPLEIINNSGGSLNALGVIFCSILKASKKDGDFKDSLIHSIINLRPVCTSCNSSEGNSNA
jgi:hypothetical protein